MDWLEGMRSLQWRQSGVLVILNGGFIRKLTIFFMIGLVGEEHYS